MQVRPNLWYAIRRTSLNLIRLFILGLSLSLVSDAGAFSQVRILRQDNTTQQTIRVWKVGSPHRGDLPDSQFPIEIRQRAATLDCGLEVRAMTAREFSNAFAIALKTNDEPDILVIDNMGLVEGITTVLGRFNGIGRIPEVRASLLVVSESLRPLATQPGWQFLIKTSRNHEKAKALAMSGTRCNPNYAEEGAPWKGEQLSEVSRLAETATAAYFKNDQAVLDNLVAGNYSADSLPLSGVQNKVSGIETCGGWGNQRLAFVYTVTAFESNVRLGFRSLLVVAAKADGRWVLLLLGEDPDIVRRLQAQARPLKTNGDSEPKLRAPTLVAPADQAYFQRWPAEERPEVEWTKAGDEGIRYLLEWQYKDRTGWFGRRFEMPVAAGEDAFTIKSKATFGIGKQPHRWRIWAVSDDGEVVRSEWRVVNYLH